MLHELEEETTPIDQLAVTELHAIADALWLAYFKPAEKHTTASKKKAMDAYNRAARLCNSKQEYKTCQILTPSTHWVPKSETAPLGKVVKMPAEKLVPSVVNKILGKTLGMEVKAKKETAAKHAANTTAAPKPSAPAPAAPVEGKGKIEQILALHDAGKTNKEIIAAGFNKSTVNRQVSEYKQRKAAQNGK